MAVNAIAVSSDGKQVVVLPTDGLPARIVGVDIQTGTRAPWRESSPPDSAGAFSADHVQLSDDGTAYIQSLRRVISGLVRVDGLLD